MYLWNLSTKAYSMPFPFIDAGVIEQMKAELPVYLAKYAKTGIATQELPGYSCC